MTLESNTACCNAEGFSITDAVRSPFAFAGPTCTKVVWWLGSMKSKLKPAQLELLGMLAVCGSCAIDVGAELACARGLRHRKVPLVEVWSDKDEFYDHPNPFWAARLTEAGARVFEQHSNFILKQHTNGEWTIDSVRDEQGQQP